MEKEIIHYINSNYPSIIGKYSFTLAALFDPLDMLLYGGKLVGNDNIEITIIIGKKSVNITSNIHPNKELKDFIIKLFEYCEQLHKQYVEE
jgi:hypothetical protein